ncbi:hypothetical protein PMAYCL1PPCAC_20741, partial [Pristionchus mayeri]
QECACNDKSECAIEKHFSKNKARAYQDGVREQKERQQAAEIQRKIKERMKKEEEEKAKRITVLFASTGAIGSVYAGER